MSGISPMELYYESGIKAYNLATGEQDMVLSYYWLKEAIKYQHPQAVVLEVQMLFQDTDATYHHIGIDDMRFSLNKIKAVTELSDVRNGESTLTSYLFPLLYWHNRYETETIGMNDFIFWDDLNADKCYLKGHVLRFDSEAYGYYEGIEYDCMAGVDTIYKDKLSYLEKITSFCKGNGMQLILVKTPRTIGDWTEERHNAVVKYAENNNLLFLDYSERHLWQEAGLDGRMDFADSVHMNSYGAKKITLSISHYLDLDRRPYTQNWTSNYNRYIVEWQKGTG